MELGYWGLKGAGEPIRWLIKYLNLPVLEYNPNTPDEWFSDKKWKMGLKFPNLPYLIDGDFKLTETCAIPLYLIHKAHKPSMLGMDWQEKAKFRELEAIFGDIKQRVLDVVFLNQDHAKEFSRLISPGTGLSTKLEYLSNYLGTKDFFFNRVTWLDFVFAYQVDILFEVSASLGMVSPISRHPNLAKLAERVKKLQGVRERVEKAKDIPFMSSFFVKFELCSSSEAEEKMEEILQNQKQVKQ